MSEAYGIMAIIHYPGVSPECDEAHFDGWYSNIADAADIFELFKQRYPRADVFIVNQEQAEWRQCQMRLPQEIIQQIREAHEARCTRTGT
jgi:hypothetical protein